MNSPRVPNLFPLQTRSRGVSQIGPGPIACCGAWFTGIPAGESCLPSGLAVGFLQFGCSPATPHPHRPPIGSVSVSQRREVCIPTGPNRELDFLSTPAISSSLRISPIWFFGNEQVKNQKELPLLLKKKIQRKFHFQANFHPTRLASGPCKEMASPSAPDNLAEANLLGNRVDKISQVLT